jgi:phosphatidylinositol glycan class B
VTPALAPRSTPRGGELASFVRAHLVASLALTCVTAIGSYAYFHLDEYFQVLEPARFKLGFAPAWALPWENAERLRPWLQPAFYVLVGKAMGPLASNPFALGLACRLVTGLLAWASLSAFVRATVPFAGSLDEARLHVRVTTLTGFLPYLFVRTSSETASMAALTAGVAVLVSGCVAEDPVRLAWRGTASRMFACGVLFGIAFEARFQTAFVAMGALAWAAFVARAPARALGAFVLGGVCVVTACLGVDAWGYGEPSFPPLAYLRTNLLEGAAALFGADPPFAYLWLSPANVLAPVVVALMLLAPLAWLRNPRHPLTWTTLPFVLVHALLSHKEERFLFPIAMLATGLVVLAIGPSHGKPHRLASWLWSRRAGVGAKVLAAWSMVGLVLLALWPLGWHHHVRFTRHARALFGDEMHAAALPEFDLGLPAYHPRVYDVEKVPPDELARRLDAGTARRYLVTDSPRLACGVTSVDARARLVWSELPLWDDPFWAPRLLALVEGWNANARPPLRPLRFRSLYRLEAFENGAH